ncbi:hypothetical protein LCGC14_1035550 [marine sediment metagenome]|uniref:C1q domain-containing protein n=1 Tax=marine sediment metagenome TaxID=412755 RepID=A0A0F9MTB6_9ZZZZ
MSQSGTITAGTGGGVQALLTDDGAPAVIPDGAGEIGILGGNGIVTTGQDPDTAVITDMESPFTGDFTFQSTTASDPEVLTIENADDAAGSDANLQLNVNDGSGAGGGDAFVSYTGPADEWFHGVDKTDASDYKLQTSSVASFPSADDVMVSDIDGQVTFPNTSAFLVNPQNDQDGVTGDGANYTIIFDVVQFDQNSDWDGTSTFTAPRTGRYFFNASFHMQLTGAACTRIQFRIFTSNRNFQLLRTNGMNLFETETSTSQFLILNQSIFCNMDAGDTSLVTIESDGLAGNTQNIQSNATSTTFSGFLSC